ncbi:MAG: alanine racemase [Arenicella sp.]
MSSYRKTRVDIDLAALRHNARLAKQKANGAFVMSAIKANAYGHGLIEAANALNDVVDEFAVASLDDVVHIRQALPTQKSLTITVLSGFYRKEEMDVAAKSNATLVVYDDHQLALLSSYGDADDDLTTPLNIWLKVDTGMSRLGFPIESFQQVTEKIESIPNVSVRGVISHFANSDVVGHELNALQVEKFQCLRKRYMGKKWHWSIANSGALMSMPDVAFDWVRPGIMLYGSSPLGGRQAHELGLKPVMTFKSEIISIRDVKKHESIGYGSHWTAQEDIRVGVIACGYGDGYPRVIQEGTPILVNQQRTRILGRVSMDLIVVDLNHICAEIGTEVTLWGEGLSVDEIAKSAGTIGYELLCSITERVSRNYI